MRIFFVFSRTSSAERSFPAQTKFAVGALAQAHPPLRALRVDELNITDVERVAQRAEAIQSASRPFCHAPWLLQSTRGDGLGSRCG